MLPTVYIRTRIYNYFIFVVTKLVRVCIFYRITQTILWTYISNIYTDFISHVSGQSNNKKELPFAKSNFVNGEYAKIVGQIIKFALWKLQTHNPFQVKWFYCKFQFIRFVMRMSSHFRWLHIDFVLISIYVLLWEIHSFSCYCQPNYLLVLMVNHFSYIIDFFPFSHYFIFHFQTHIFLLRSLSLNLLFIGRNVKVSSSHWTKVFFFCIYLFMDVCRCVKSAS